MLAACIGISALLLAAPSNDGSERVARAFERLDQAMSTPTGTRPLALAAVVAANVDFDSFAATVMSDVEVTSRQKTRLTAALRELISARAERLIRHHEGPLCDETKVRGEQITCRADAKLYIVRLHMAPKTSRIVDVTFGGATLSRSYRGMVNKLMRTRGFEGLIRRLEERTVAEKTKSADHESIAER